MISYRIALAIHANKLIASGNSARWNSKDVMVIYASSSRSLACLENVVHRNFKNLNNQFMTIIIEIPGSLKMERIDRKDLPADWHEFQNIPYTQQIGDHWIAKSKSAVLQVPSVIIPEEFNYLLNPAHKDFSKIKLISSEPFQFDARLKD
jgi:RES domain-containing protein